MASNAKNNKNSDCTWENCVCVNDDDKDKNSRLLLMCNYCKKQFWGGVSRMKHHLAQTNKDVAKCDVVPDDVRDLFRKLLDEMSRKKISFLENMEGDCFEEFDNKERGSKDCLGSYLMKGSSCDRKKQVTLNAMVKDREMVCRDICRFFYGHALPFHLVKSPLFSTMMQSAINFGKGLKLPSYHEVRVSYLKKEVDSIHVALEKYRLEWKKTGCTLMSDGWSDNRQKSITNFLVNSPRGTVFIKSVDTSSISKNAQNLFAMLDEMVDLIGEEHVVQVVTDSALAYVAAGEMLMEKRKKLFWSPCAAHCIDLMLSDIGGLQVHKVTMEKARKVTVFIYRHSWVLDLMRKYTKKRELARPAITRFATSYLTLRSIFEQKMGLRALFAPEEWGKSGYAKSRKGIEVENIILGDSKFWQGIKYCLKGVIPLVQVLRLVDGDVKPAMSYIFETMERAKIRIKQNFDNVERRYKSIIDIINTRWALQLHRPLHAAAFYLNPKYHYNDTFDPSLEVKMGLYKTIERMCQDIEDRIKINEQMEKFKNLEGMFGMEMARLTRDRKQPALWWESYGSSCLELQKLAIRILSLTCSATGCERNWSIFDHVHSKKRNRLEQQRVNALVFVTYNINLELRQTKREENGDTHDPICLSDMESDDEWITEKEDPCLRIDDAWMDLDLYECFQIKEGEMSKRKGGPQNLNSMSKRKKKGIQEDDNQGFEEYEVEGDQTQGNVDIDEIIMNNDDDDLGVDLENDE